MTDRGRKLIEIFEDTQRFYSQNEKLAKAVQASKNATKLYEADDYPSVNRQHAEPAVTVTMHKSFEAAMEIHRLHPEMKIAVLNFASAANPGGGVESGSSAQEESLCRCSTLYPTLTQDWLWRKYYQKNRESGDNLHTDACIYSPGIVICKSDGAYPERMEEKDWITVDVISCAAPNLRKFPGNIHNPEYGAAAQISSEELYRLHLKRAEHIIHVAAANEVDALVLGAFGCGAFANDPEVVAKAYSDVDKTGIRYIEFAVFCMPHETRNYEVFRRRLMPTAPSGLL